MKRKSKRAVKRKFIPYHEVHESKPAAPKIKKVVLSPSYVTHIEAPEGHVPVVVPGPAPHVMRVIPVPPEKAQTWMEYFFGPERK